jgi:hypothetical protein
MRVTPALMRGFPLPALLSLLAPFAACSKEQPAHRPDAALPKAARGLAAGDPQLVGSLRAVLEHCQVSSETGRISHCPDDEDGQLRKQERALGIGVVLKTYCHGLGERDERVRALSASGLSRAAYYHSVARDPALLACLNGALDGLEDQRVARPLARAAAYVATAMGREKELLPILSRAELAEVKAAGYGALWANGRLRVFDALSKVIGDPGLPIPVRVAAINGFDVGGPLRPREQGPVCGLVAPLLTAESLALSASAARCAAESCPGLKDRVLDAAESLRKKGTLNPDHISAVRAVDSVPYRASSEQRERILAFLTTVVDDERFGSATRAAALSKVGWIDRNLAVKLARKHHPTAEGALRQTVEWLLEGLGK